MKYQESIKWAGFQRVQRGRLGAYPLVYGAAWENRTPDLFITSESLYRLS
jgi:hypothetical protein